MKAAIVVCTLTLAAAPASAQQAGRPYAGVTFGTHVEKADDVRGSSPALGVVAGIPFTARWTLEVEASRPTGVFSRTTDLFRREREVTSSISVGAVFRPRLHPRIAPRIFLGVTNHHVIERTTAFTTIPAEQQFTRNLGGPSIGGGAAIALTRRLALAPEVRYDYGSIGDEINNVWQTSIRILYGF
jgi:hypothetical protein